MLIFIIKYICAALTKDNPNPVHYMSHEDQILRLRVLLQPAYPPTLRAKSQYNIYGWESPRHLMMLISPSI